MAGIATTFNCSRNYRPIDNFYRIFDSLKKFVSVSLFFVFLSANTELHQLLKLPVLIHHYLAHHQDEEAYSFFHFLSNHYSSNSEHSDKNHQEHDNLPFKKANCPSVLVSLAFINHTLYSIPRPIDFCHKISPIYKGAIYSSSVVKDIWQPPKIS
jgi:hypothetical protein